MTDRTWSRLQILMFVFLSLGLLAAATSAQADAFQITLTNLTFGGSSGSEVFNGSFVFDSSLKSVTALDILATGVTDILIGGPLLFGGVDITGIEPSQFAFDDGLSDFLLLSLPSGLAASSYDFPNADLSPSGPLSSLGFAPGPASSGSFSVTDTGPGGVPTPEPSSVWFLLIGMVALFGCMTVRARRDVRSTG
jgi:hypothetical protein